MTRRCRLTWLGALVSGLAVLAVAVLVVPPAGATLKYGALQLSGSFETQNLIRHPNPTHYQFVQNRNTMRLRVDWDWFHRGKLIDRFEIPFIKSSKFYLLYRGVYDGFFDLAPADNQRGFSKFDDLVGGPIEGNRVGTLEDACDPLVENCLRAGGYSRTDVSRNQIKRENELHEVYVDFALRDFPVSFRVGRQQVVWGEADQFRMMDIWNPIDLRWHMQQEPFTEIREPLWMVKGLWDIKRIPVPKLDRLTDTFLEVVWNPFDYQPGVRVDYLPLPWGLPQPNPVRPGQIQVVSPDLRGLVSPEFNLNGTGFLHGDFKRNPEDASGVGARFHAVTPQGIEFTMNYLYHRGRGIGAAAGTGSLALKIKEVRINLQKTTTIHKEPGQVTGTHTRCRDPKGCDIQNLVGTFDGTGAPRAANFSEVGTHVFRGFVDAEFIHPYTHIFGLTANYFEADLTQTVFRLETAYAMDLPYMSARLPTTDIDGTILVDGDRPPILVASSQDIRYAPGLTKRDVWAGMIGFDRPTWISWLNKKTTWFITGQFFWSYVNGATPWLRQTAITASDLPYFDPSKSESPEIFPQSLRDNRGVGQWLSGPYAGLTERVQDSSFKGVNSDNVRRWEYLFTLAAFSFYKGGSVMPWLAWAFDPVNMGFLAQPSIQYFYTNNFIIRLGGKYFTNFGRNRFGSLDPWTAGGQNARRDETELRFTLQF